MQTPDKIRAISELLQPKSIWDIQKFTGRMTALTRSASESAKKALPLFKVQIGRMPLLLTSFAKV